MDTKRLRELAGLNEATASNNTSLQGEPNITVTINSPFGHAFPGTEDRVASFSSFKTSFDDLKNPKLKGLEDDQIKKIQEKLVVQKAKELRKLAIKFSADAARILKK